MLMQLLTQMYWYGFIAICLCVCLLPHNLEGYFVSLLSESMARKNKSPSDKQLWQFVKKSLLQRNSHIKPYQSVAILKFLYFC